MSDILTTTYTATPVKCPICNDAMEVQVAVELVSTSVTQTGTIGTTPQFTANVETEVVGAHIDHDCRPAAVKQALFAPAKVTPYLGATT